MHQRLANNSFLMVMQLAPNTFFFSLVSIAFVCGKRECRFDDACEHATTKHCRPMAKDRFLENFFAVSFCEMRSNAVREVRKRAWVWHVFHFFFRFFLSLAGSLHFLVLSHNALSSSNKVSQSSFIGIARSRHRLVPTNMCSQSKYCLLYSLSPIL